MKIVEVNKFHYFRRGTSRHYFSLIDALERAGHMVAHFSMQSSNNIVSPWEKYFVSYCGYNTNDSHRYERLIGIGRLFWSFEARKKFRKLIEDFQPDAVHVHNAYHQLSLSFFPIVKEKKIPFLMTVHDYAMISPDKDEYDPKIGKQYWKFLCVKKYGFGKRILLVVKKYWEDCFGFYDYVDRFIVPSRYVENVLISAGVPVEKIVLLPHFIPKGSVSEQPEDITLPEKFLFSFGAISKEKGIETLLDISKKIGLPLVLAGRKESGFDPKKHPDVIFLGMRKQSELNWLIERAMCVMGASELPETFGLVALETIDRGRPYFGLDRGALAEIIENGKNGYLAKDPEELIDAIRKYIGGGISFNENVVRESARKFSETSYVDHFTEVLTKI